MPLYGNGVRIGREEAAELFSHAQRERVSGIAAWELQA